MKITEAVQQKIEPIMTEMGYEIVEVEFVKRNGQDNLTVYMDCPAGVSLDDCEKVTMAVDSLLEELDPTAGKPYVFNVSSPGLDRPFKKHRDYERNYGKEVEIKLYAPMQGKKIFEGVLISHDDNVTEIETFDGKKVKIENTKAAFVRPLVKFE